MAVQGLDEVAAEVDRYVLGTGEAGADRLRILHRAYGPGTRRFLDDPSPAGDSRVDRRTTRMQQSQRMGAVPDVFRIDVARILSASSSCVRSRLPDLYPRASALLMSASSASTSLTLYAWMRASPR